MSYLSDPDFPPRGGILTAMPNDRLTAAQLEGILSIADDAIICVDGVQRILFFNHGAEDIFGYQAAEILGQPLDLLLPPRFQNKHHEHMASFGAGRSAARRMGERREIVGRRKDGSEFPAEASISRLGGEDFDIYTAILRDVSERKARERELREARDTAEAATQAKSMFLANMSHEIRTPLNAVVGMTSLLLNTDITDEQRDYAKTIRASSEALLSIINDILDYSKIELGKLEIERHPFDLRRAIEESLDLVSPAAAEKNLNLAYLIEESVPASLVGDVARLRQILVNLLSNATKFTHQGEVVISVAATRIDGGRHELHVTVRDTGIGIPAERVDHLFRSFTQVDASTTRKYGGTGLGLAISKRLVEMMGGHMWVESALGQGSSFHFTVLADAAGAQTAHSILQDRSSALSGKRVLIVDDNTTNRRILVKQALLWGMLPSAAASGVEALDLVRHGHAFDVGILDMHMPEMDGLTLAAEIRRHRDPTALPLIMLTSIVHRPKPGFAEEIRFASYLSKPIKPTALFEALTHALHIASLQPATETTGYTERLADSVPLAILVAEDNNVNQKVMQKLLAHLGYRADLVSTGVEALDALERQNYDVVLMDVQMPEMDGIEATRRIRARYGNSAVPRIIAMTANAMQGDREACLAAGMNDYIAKPVELDDLRKALAALAPVVPPAAPASADDGRILDLRRLDQLRELQDEENPHLVADLVEMFLRDSPSHLDGLQAAIDANDAEALRRIAHRFLSSIENLGARHMRERCTALEDLGRRGTTSGAAALLAQLSADFGEARGALQRMLTTEPAA